MKDKVINFMDLENATLKNIYDFSVYDTDKIIINYKNFTEKELNDKIASMHSTLYKLSKIIYNDENELWDEWIKSINLETDDDKFWIKIEYNNNLTEITATNNIQEIMNIILFLEDCMNIDENDIYGYICNKIDKVFMFQKRIFKGIAYFNYDLKIVENLLE